ncbi:MAG: isoprenyl transferase [Candidatus Omnitrophota bacterium]|nr:isoprenyl transferase [Candidatus Omnitrophota bacterium]MDZ4241860.1 isoprenyl transferase [Candidatus Omnitrophota bacterium]
MGNSGPESAPHLPRHVAIIMDGNGRWAKSRNLPRTQGHLEGVRRVEEIVEAARLMGIKVLTLYTFSTENWNRPLSEVQMLMTTLCAVLDRKVNQLIRDNIRLQTIGRKDGLPADVIKSMERTSGATKDCTGLILNLALNYGGRSEILDAAKNLAEKVTSGQMSLSDISEETFQQALYTAGMPDPDLLIRTSGEQRISNFLLWQLSYAEFYFTDIYWPQFNTGEFQKAIADYQKRDRRYGRVGIASS